MDLKSIGTNLATGIKPHIQTVAKFCNDNAPTLLAIGGMVGNGATLITSAMAGAKSQRMIFEEEVRLGRSLTREEKFKLCWKNYIIPTVCCGLGCACTWQSNREATARLMAANALANLATEKLRTLEEKVDEELPKDKADKVKKAVDLEGVKEAMESNAIENTGRGSTIFKDATMGGYFYSEHWIIKDAVNKINEAVLTGFSNEQSLNDFYDLLGRDPIGCGWHLGWDLGENDAKEHLMMLEPEIIDDSLELFGRPVVKIKYNIFLLHNCAKGLT